MAAPPFPVCLPNTRRTAAIAVAAAPVTRILRLIRSIIGIPLDHCHGCACGSKRGSAEAAARFSGNVVRNLIAQVVLALKPNAILTDQCSPDRAVCDSGAPVLATETPHNGARRISGTKTESHSQSL